VAHCQNKLRTLAKNFMITFILLSHQDIESLQAQLKEFTNCSSEYIRLLVVESGEKENIIPRLSEIRDYRVKFIFNEKSGIYSSMNHAISCVQTKYYLVLGLDDEFNYSKVVNICSYINSNDFGIIFLGVKKGLTEMAFLNTEKISSGPQGIFPSHTGGAVIRTKLHDIYGKYDEEYKVVADGLFILRCMKGGVLVSLYPVICCKVGDNGFSKKNELLAEWESYKVRSITGSGFYYSFILFIIRLSRRIVKKLTANIVQ
jgi:hypothetical protein